MEWILVQEPPRDVPVPFVASSHRQNPGTGLVQHGVLIAVHWLVDGDVVAQEMSLPIRWPHPVAVADGPLRLDLGTAIAPVMLETRVFQALDENGLPHPPASAIWCRYLDATATCRITREAEHDNWQVHLDLPAGASVSYGSMRGEWRIPSDSSLAENWESLAFDADWIFSVMMA